MEHPLRRDIEMVFACKKCKKTFRKDMTVYDDSDEYCPHCDNHYVRLHGSPTAMKVLRSATKLTTDAFLRTQVVEAKIPQAMLVAEGEDSRKDSR